MADGILQLRYKNYRGEISERKLVPMRMYWGNTQYHPENQWLMEATDVTDPENPKVRDFAMKDFNPDTGHDEAIRSLEGYKAAFYEIATMMGFTGPAVEKSPKDMYHEHIRPQLAWLIEAGSKIGDEDNGR